MRREGKVAIVTGRGTGIGRSACQCLPEKGQRSGAVRGAAKHPAAGTGITCAGMARTDLRWGYPSLDDCLSTDKCRHLDTQYSQRLSRPLLAFQSPLVFQPTAGLFLWCILQSLVEELPCVGKGIKNV
jgi:hypothetical protein